ncbi:MAG: 50S ribosomal protein L25 [Lentisphaeria bacterium]|nr:50S ribosomal protein L25 [Lentisphaeria bacterium]
MAKTKHVLNVKLRSEGGSANARRLRREGLIPAVIYGCGTESKSVSVCAQEWEMLSRGELNMLTLKLEDGTETLALLKEVQTNFITLQTSHIDFMAVNPNEKIQAKVAIHAGHAAPAGEMFGGILDQMIHEVEVECLPADLPESIEVDVSGLNVGDVLHLEAIKAPAGVKILGHADQVIFAEVDPNASADAAAPADGATEPEIVGAKEKAEKAAAKE